MQVKILRSTVASGKNVTAGKVYENLSAEDAHMLITLGKAVEVDPKAKKQGGAKAAKAEAAKAEAEPEAKAEAEPSTPEPDEE
jgi:topoisomerase IA-like protein